MKVLFAASECAPIVKVGGLADVVGSLPKALSRLGVEVAVALPNYEFLGEIPPKTLPGTEIPVFYLGSREDYPGAVYPGGFLEHQRFSVFSRQLANFLSTRQFEPQIVHCHDYHTALLIDILKERKDKTATVLTLHDAGNKGDADASILAEAGLSSAHIRALDLDLKDNNVEMLLQGIVAADVINTVSPTYAREIMNAEISGSLADVLKAREARVFGILNGIDTDFYNPKLDKNIFANYGVANAITAKRENKLRLQERLGLKKDANAPLLGIVTRLVERKGLDLILKSLSQILVGKTQLVVLGKGGSYFEEAFSGLAKVSKDFLSFTNTFNELLSHQIYAASDFFLVPSRTEPCGLTQMIAMRYGSLPIVHKTGGLADSVEDGVTGFVFDGYTPESFMGAYKKALGVYGDLQILSAMVGQAMERDFSWVASAKLYVKLYEKALQYNFGIARVASSEVRERSLGGWTLLSEERSKRPWDVGQGKGKEAGLGQGIGPSEGEIEKCPFEEGHEHLSPGEVFRLGSGEPDNPGWEVRVIPNKYPLVPAHEVVVYSPNHQKDLSDLPLLWVEKVVWAYLSRYRHYEDKGYVHIFCNHGTEAAASLTHPHSQIVVLDRLPDDTKDALEAAGVYYENHHRCPYCDTLSREVPRGQHFVWQNEFMVVCTPYASEWPYELTILPKIHRQSFGNINDDELKALAEALQFSIKILKKLIPELSYNFWIHSVPNYMGYAKTALYYHWHIDIAPRVKKLGGLELGAGVMVDDLISPEKAAEVLRGQLDFISQ